MPRTVKGLRTTLKPYENAVARQPYRAEALYELSIVLLAFYQPTASAALLHRAKLVVRRLVRLAPLLADAHALLGWTLDCGARAPQAAIHALEEAHRLAPADRLVETLLLTLLAEHAAADVVMPRLEAAAQRQGIDLAGIRQQLQAQSFPLDPHTLLLNAFPHARNAFRAWIATEAERIDQQRQPARHAALQRRAQEDCLEERRRVRKAFRPERVPAALRPCIPWALKYGIGDDPCRAHFLAQMSKREQHTLQQRLAEHASALHDWLDSFGQNRLSTEAAAFLYLLQAYEELRTDADSVAY